MTDKLASSDVIETECCGTIKRCTDKPCIIGRPFAGAGKCVHCAWIWEMPEGREGYPLSKAEMEEAHR